MSLSLDNIDLYSWPFEEANKIVNYLKKSFSKNNICRFETGYGPSGLPHLGTFCEVKRMVYVINAFQKISNIPVDLICFSDDLDPLKSIPDNVPNPDMLTNYIGSPVSFVPDPFKESKSFADYMNNKMKSFLSSFDIKYTFLSSRKCYESGMFDDYLIKVLQKYDDIMNVMLPTLRDERRKSYSPFLPICPDTNKVLQVAVNKICLKENTISYFDPLTNELKTTKVTGGKCKLQWKPDFAMRWAALDIKYEIYGKDHLANEKIYFEICNILGKSPPLTFSFEMFLDENGKKISKSKGNALSLDNLLKYFPKESIELFLYMNPKKSKKLSLDAMVKSTDQYMQLRKDYVNLDLEKKINSPIYHIHNAEVCNEDFGDINFSMLLNLISILNIEDCEFIKSFVLRYDSNIDFGQDSYFLKLIDYAIKYYKDFIKPRRNIFIPSSVQVEVLHEIIKYINPLDFIDAVEAQNYLYSLAMKHAHSNMREFFQGLYKVLLGFDNGPRFGTLFSILGKEESLKLLKKALTNE